MASVPEGRTLFPEERGSGGQYRFSAGFMLKEANVDGFTELLWYPRDLIHEPLNGV